MVDSGGITGSAAAAVAVAVAAATVPAFLQVLVAPVMGTLVAFFLACQRDGGRMEVTCNYDLDLLHNTYLYLISILGGFGQ